MRPWFVALVLTAALVVGLLVLFLRQKHSSTSGTIHLTFPGWSDVVIGGNAAKEMTCKYEDRAGADVCNGTRAVGKGEIGQIEVMRRSDLGVTVMVAEVDLPAVSTLRTRWGTPISEKKQHGDSLITWCTSDGKEGAVARTSAYGNGAMIVVAVMDREQDLTSNVPFEKPDCKRLLEDARREAESKSAAAKVANSSLTIKAIQADRALRPVRITASSTNPLVPGYSFIPDNLDDGDLTTSWQPAKGDGGAKVQLDFAVEVTISRVGIANGFQAIDKVGDQFVLNSRIARARLRFDDGSEVLLEYAPDARGITFADVPASKTRSVVLLVDDTHRGTRWNDLAISEIELFGKVEAGPMASFALPGWEDLILGKPVPVAVKLTCDPETSQCEATRPGTIATVEINRDGTGNVANVSGNKLTKEVVRALTTKWGTPIVTRNDPSGTGRELLWCSSDWFQGADVADYDPASVLIGTGWIAPAARCQELSRGGGGGDTLTFNHGTRRFGWLRRGRVVPAKTNATKDLCIAYAVAQTELCTRCAAAGDDDPYHGCWDATDGGRCHDATNVRDDALVRSQCLPAVKRMMCAAYRSSGATPKECGEQFRFRSGDTPDCDDNPRASGC